MNYSDHVYSESAAKMLARQLNSSEEDGWTYVAFEVCNGKYKVMVFDENNNHEGNL